MIAEEKGKEGKKCSVPPPIRFSNLTTGAPHTA